MYNSGLTMFNSAMTGTLNRNMLRGAALAAAALGLGAAVLGGAVVGLGLYNVASTDQHFQLTHSVLEAAMRASVRRQAAAIRAPVLDHMQARQGAPVYAARCAGCHGGPGIAPQPYAMSMQPAPGGLVDAARKWEPAELYWITRHGIKMSGMPAWEFHLSEPELWAVVAFLQRLPRLTPAGYAAALDAAMTQDAQGTAAPLPAATASPGIETPAAAPPGQPPRPDPRRGKLALTQYACHACHMIPGIAGSRVHIGPPLAGIASRVLIAGKLPNTPDNLARWIRTPQGFDPRTAMPAMGVTERDARDIAAYLRTLD